MSRALDIARDLSFRQWTFVPVGDIKYVDVGDEPPTDTHFRYIKLTAGEDGVGQYNEGVVTNETITGSGDTLVATVDIDDVDSPINGATVNLLNTENRYIMPGESPGSVANDQMQRITGNLRSPNSRTSFVFGDGAFNLTGNNNPVVAVGSGSSEPNNASFDSSNDPGSRTGTKTNVKHIQQVAYMRIR